MQAVIARIFQGLAWFVLAGLVVEFYLAGVAIFGATTYQPHRALGVGLGVAILLLLVLALVARPTQRVVGLTVLLTVLTIVQVALPSLRTSLSPVAALHVVNAAALLAIAGAIVRTPGDKVSARRSPEGPAQMGSDTN